MLTPIIMHRISELAGTAQYLKTRIRELCKGFKFSQNPHIVEIRTMQQTLRGLDISFYKLQGINPRKSLSISGFPMPLQCEEDVERLELMVKRNPKIRQQYIEFLRCKKALSADISDCFTKFFSEEAMGNYSWPMNDTCKTPRKPMNNYQIFTVCMLVLQPKNHSGVSKVDGFCFPLSCPEDIERLEHAVLTDPTVRSQYINFLKSKKSHVKPVSKCFEHVFSHLSLYNYCLHQQDGFNLEKKVMTQYDIFTKCMLAAANAGKDFVKLKQELLELDRTLNRETVLRRNLQVGQLAGFKFPLQTEKEVLRLEQAVETHPTIRKQYVRYLAARLQSKTDVSKCFSQCFKNAAIINFEWTKSSPSLRRSRIKTVPEHYDIIIAKLSKSAGKQILKFPLETSTDIETLEELVRDSNVVKRQYEQLLRNCLQQQPKKPSLALLKLFTDKALDDYNYTGHCNYTGGKKNAMKDYLIFTECIDENQSLPAAPALMELPFVPGVRPWHVGEPVKHSIQHSPNGCFGFISSCGIHFPIDSEEMVEVLESMVREYDGARDEYMRGRSMESIPPTCGSI
uniref:DUF4806 domain-containing protein n=1 Tax=Anopheles atroparvus TaxID=41427 RepID=A0A182JE43_ANOAO